MSNFRIYVGTYGKYNDGSIAGEWIDVENLSNDEFTQKIELIHSDEDDAEFMFQDYEVPAAFENLIDEGFISHDFWSLKDWYNEQTDTQQEAFNAFVQLGNDPNIIEFEEKFFCHIEEWNTDEAFGYYMLEEMGELNQVPMHLRYYIDAEAYGRDLLINDFSEFDGFIFRNY